MLMMKILYKLMMRNATPISRIAMTRLFPEKTLRREYGVNSAIVHPIECIGQRTYSPLLVLTWISVSIEPSFSFNSGNFDVIGTLFSISLESVAPVISSLLLYRYMVV